MTNWADTSIGVTQFIGSAAAFAAKAGPTALPVIEFFAGFIPGADPVIKALEIAIPIIAKVAAAAPVITKILQTEKPTIDKLQETAPDLIGHLKELYAIAVNNDPDRPEADMKAVEVSNDQLEWFAGSIFQRSFFTPQDPRFENKDFD